ncbi:MAG: hypothetical protein ACLFVQ_01625 [Chitinispirillaceae bacterium]
MGAIKKTLLPLTIAAVTGTVFKYFSFRRKRTQRKLSHRAMKARRDLQKRFGMAVRETRRGLNQMIKTTRRTARA